MKRPKMEFRDMEIPFDWTRLLAFMIKFSMEASVGWQSSSVQCALRI